MVDHGDSATGGVTNLALDCGEYKGDFFVLQADARSEDVVEGVDHEQDCAVFLDQPSQGREVVR